jgi:acetoin utilization deacetylase AcuC-like enzyme
MLIFDVPGQEQHSPPFELQGGAFGPAYETPARQTSIAAALRAAQIGDWLPVSPQPEARLARVHSADYLDFLSQAWGLWQARFPTSNMALPYAFPVAPLSTRAPQSIVGLLGRYAFDVGTPLLAGTWGLAKAAADAALSAADALWAGAQAGLDRFAF